MGRNKILTKNVKLILVILIILFVFNLGYTCWFILGRLNMFPIKKKEYFYT